MQAFERLFPDLDIAVACRRVLEDDLDRLTADEKQSFAGSAPAVKSRAAAARIAARELLAEEGFPGWSLPRLRGKAPVWPPGVIGSLAHSDEHAAAAVTRDGVYAGVGIDIEPAEPLPRELLDVVVSPAEAEFRTADDLAARVIFCAKEACYKAVFPGDGRFLDYADVTVDLDAMTAVTRYGTRVDLSIQIDTRIVVAARLRHVRLCRHEP